MMPLHSYNATYPNIMIDDPGGASSFLLTAREALDKIDSKPLGHRLLTEIQKHAPVFANWGGSIKIYRGEGSIATPTNSGGAYTAGIGSASGVKWNSNIYSAPYKGGQRPAFIGLAHELIHAWHNALGIAKTNYDDEESFTVGLGAYMIPGPNSITENMIRLEHNVAIRHEY